MFSDEFFREVNHRMYELISQREFACKKCGADCDAAPVDGSGAICPDCCEGHDYKYCSCRQGHFCKHCDILAPDDYDGDF